MLSKAVNPEPIRAICVPARPALGERYDRVTLLETAENGTKTVAELVLEPAELVTVKVTV